MLIFMLFACLIKHREWNSLKCPQFLVALLLVGAIDGKRSLRGNAGPLVDNRDAVMMITKTFPLPTMPII